VENNTTTQTESRPLLRRLDNWTLYAFNPTFPRHATEQEHVDDRPHPPRPASPRRLDPHGVQPVLPVRPPPLSTSRHHQEDNQMIRRLIKSIDAWTLYAFNPVFPPTGRR
jgi:hypothetical protein